MVHHISVKHGPHSITRTSGDTCLLHKELPSGMLLVDVLLRSKIFPFSIQCKRRGPILDALFRIYMGFYFGPHHLIMAALLYFDEKVRRKKLQNRLTRFHRCFFRLSAIILEHMGYPTKPHLKRNHHYREHFTINQWTQLAKRNSAESTPEAAPPRPVPPVPAQPDRHTTPPVPPVAPPPSQDFITISGSEFRGMVLLFRTLNATHDALFWKMRDIRAQQDHHSIILDQHTAILSQIQQHLGLAPPQTDIPRPLKSRAPLRR
ncbi:hypothetical protein CK203_113240 [Vitis vinifera]|uniref:Uncharacterized protein n=1 Tax=Vitis vinifera TaxID=29760 RepID=A0A438CBY9_VITVI|nr:hypothetical protein CK203_113240 [Vitis vinifera]